MATLVAAAVGLSACGSSLLSTASTDAPRSPVTSTSTTAAPLGEVAVAFPVVVCTTPTGGSLGSSGWKPSVLLAPIPTTLVGKVEFYADGIHTVLGPSGWNCTQTVSSGGASGLTVYPANASPPLAGVPATAGAQGVFATFDSTGHVPGIALVCPFFTLPSWQDQEAACTGTKPNGEQSSMPTPDVASVTDPAGVIGSLEGSGGFGPVTGTVVFPQVEPAVTDGSAVSVASESCSLPDPSLCPTVLSDFDVREFPAPASTYTPTTTPTYRPSTPTTVTVPATTAPPAAVTPPGPPTTKRPGDHQDSHRPAPLT